MKQRKSVPKIFVCPPSAYYIKNAHGEYQKADKSTVQMMLIKAGYMNARDCESLSPCSQQMLNIALNRSVHWAGPVSGMKVGMHQISGFRILVTTECHLPKAKEGTLKLWPTILEEQYGEQLPYLLAWLKAARQRVERNNRTMIPALVISGGKGTGKSLLQNVLITHMLGGRAANGFRYMNGDSKFNEDMVAAEHIMIEDQIYPMKQQERQKLGEAIKSAVANESVSMHAKGDKALTIRCLWCLSISINEEPHLLKMLPLNEESCADKLLLLRVLKRPEILPVADDKDPDNKSRFEAQLLAEIPAFVHWLQNYEVPKEFQGERSLVHPWKNPDLMAIVHEDDKVELLMHFLTTHEIASPSWTGTTNALADVIRQSAHHSVSDRLVNNLAVTMKQLVARYPERAGKDGSAHGNITKWRITMPPPGQADMNLTTEQPGGVDFAKHVHD